MENIFRVLKQLMGTGSMLGSIPKPIKMGMTYLAVVVGVMAVFRFAKLSQTERTFLIIALVVLAIITAGYYAWKGWMQKQQNKQFGGEISQHSSATPRGVSDPGQRARLDDMRKKFQSGVEAYKSRGKDLYKLPWYVIVGEPGSGKTEAIRHSNVGFPPGMQDEFQGVGGTINMNWWFTNHAVLLDTAGRLMFEEVKPGETSEWKEFLTLLKKNRPNCPINGLFLVIPSDSLIKDSADAIQKKAGKIAQQLDVIQRVLDVRFPVFVVVTKCDKINGFREFFDGLTDPQLQHQMMGWSNPDPLDEPFKPEMVDKHLEQVAARLRRRRLGLMRDPVPENTDGRRTDEVDTLYAFPHSLELLASRLRRYLETIFIAGEWSAKPLFLRGIYFSSAMREGSALDAELAEAIGMSVEDLPEGKVWERERAYFLRDLFLEKVFREKGLVTRATNTRRMLRGQQFALLGFGFLALVMFSAVAWYAKGNLRSSVTDQADYWQVSAAGWDNKIWNRSVVPMRNDGSFVPTISTNIILVDNKPFSVGEFHAKLRDSAEKPLKKNLMFPGLADRYNRDSRKAQRIVFEAGVVRPLIEATRQKMREESEPGSAQFQADALAALIQLEADILSRGMPGANTGEVTPGGATRFLGVFQNYIVGREIPVDTNIVAVMAWTYSTNDAAKGSWPPKRFGGGRTATNTLAGNDGINAGLAQFVRNATNGVQTQLSDWNQISAVISSARKFTNSEQVLFRAAKDGDEEKFRKARGEVEVERRNLEAEMANASGQPLFAESVSLTNALQKFRENFTRSAAAALVRIRATNDTALIVTKNYPLFMDIKAQLDRVEASLTGRLAQVIATNDLKELQWLDETCLAEKFFAKRAELYAQAGKLSDERPFAAGILVGSRGEQLEKFLTNRIEVLRAEAAAYAGKLKSEFTNTVGYDLKRVEKLQSDVFFKAYLAEAQRQLAANSGFPLVGDLSHMTTANNLMLVGKQLKNISDDLASSTFQNHKLADRLEWRGFIASVKGQQLVAQALLDKNGNPGLCTIYLAASTDATAEKDEWQDQWRDLKLVSEGLSTDIVRARSDTEQELGKTPVQQKFELRFFQNAREANPSPPYSFSTESWGPLSLIHRYKGQRQKGSPESWLVEFKVPAPGGKGMLRLKLKFERVLPELEEWAMP